MSKNLDQIYIANPITTNASTDLMYFMQSPYTPGTDAGMTYSNFASQFGAPYIAAALTETDDTNVTLTLGGTPSIALLQAVSITAGWTGTLSGARGGTGVANTGLTIDLSSGSVGKVLTSDSSGNATWQASGGGGGSIPYVVAGGTPNALTLTYSPAISSYTDGLILSFRTGASANSGAVTLNANGLGAVALVTENNTAFVGAELAANGSYIAIYNASFSKFVLQSYVTATAIQNMQYSFAVATGSSNAYAITVSPAPSAYKVGQIFVFTANFTNTGIATININGLGAIQLAYEAASGLAIQVPAGGIVSGRTYVIVKDSARFVVLNPSLFATSQDTQLSATIASADSGTLNAYAMTLSPVPLNNPKMVIMFNPNSTNTGPATLNINSLGAFSIVTQATSGTFQPLRGNEIVISGTAYLFLFRSSSWVLINPVTYPYDYETPSTGFTISAALGIETLILDPSGLLATGTINLPANPLDNQKIYVSSTNTVTSLTVASTDGSTVMNAPTTIVAGSGFAYIFKLSGTTWFRLY